MTVLAASSLPEIPVGDWFASLVDWINNHFGPLLDFIDWLLRPILYDHIDAAFLWVPPIAMAVLLALLAALARSWRFGVFAVVGLLLIQSMGLWKDAMDTLTLVVIAAALAMLLSIPLGILAARSRTASAVLRPLMDLVQTMPAFVYLIPTLFFWGIGVTPGVVATIVFAMAPGVRLTELGIRQVDKEMVEAGHAFGARPGEILRGVQLPLALPTIMAGVNQVIMLSLSMVVIAGIVGAGGLGGVVYSGITRLDLGRGFEGGLGVVILAIFLDRVTAALGDRRAPRGAARRGGRTQRRGIARVLQRS